MSKRHESRHRPAKCPACGSVRVARIEYGMPVFTPELEAKLKAGQVRLGGCCITDDDPAWQCADCGARIHRKNDGP
jgi:hypothetical protein